MRKRIGRGRKITPDKPKPYTGPPWIGQPITPPPVPVGPHWIGQRIPYRDRRRGGRD
jgi:hypothetical protein